MLQIGQIYDITANLCVEDGIINGAECTLKHIEYGQHSDFPQYVWVKCANPEVGHETQHKSHPKYQPYTAQEWTPIDSVLHTFVVKRSQTVTR